MQKRPHYCPKMLFSILVFHPCFSTRKSHILKGRKQPLQQGCHPSCKRPKIPRHVMILLSPLTSLSLNVNFDVYLSTTTTDFPTETTIPAPYSDTTVQC